MRRGGAILAALGVALLARPSPATPDDAPRAPQAPRYAPVPPGIAALLCEPALERLADQALPSLGRPPEALPVGTARFPSREAARALVLAGDAGLRRVAERLAAETLPPDGLLDALAVVAASPRREADALLEIAAGEARPEARMFAAWALGAGRTAGAAEPLGRLARDPVSGVRAAALRSLFATETPAAVALRRALPDDPQPDVLALRLRLHRLRGDLGPEVARRAVRAWAFGASGELRLEAARLLSACGSDAPDAVLGLVVVEGGTDATRASWVRRLLGGAPPIADRSEGRLAAAEALLALLARPGLAPEVRHGLLDLAVDWIAHPARSRGRQIDEEARSALFAALPDAKAALVEPVTTRLAADRFEDPAQGVRLLLGLPDDLALAALRSLASRASALERPVLGAVSGGLRDLRRIGDGALAAALTDPAMPPDVRSDATTALLEDDPAIAWPLLSRLLRDRDASVASVAAAVVEQRGGPEGRRLLEAALLEGRWPAWGAGALRAVSEPADEEAYDFLARALRKGPLALRHAVFSEVNREASRLRGPRAVALVRMAIDDPSLGLDVGDVATALCSVDGPAGVRWVRDHWRTWRAPEVLVRNLQVVADREALDFALELAALLRDDQEGMLGELSTVLSGPCAKDPARTDPFWKRLLSKGSAGLRRTVLEKLPRTAHGPLAVWLVPWIANRNESADVRLHALLACAGEKGQPPTPLLWGIASDRTEDPDLRAASAAALLERTDAALRAKALAWLSEKIDEWSEAVALIADLAGRGAGPSEAADLLQLLRDDLAQRYRERPYFRRRTDDEDTALGNRASSLVRALAATGDGPSLDALAATLFDPRFATWSSEAGARAALRRPRGGGPLSPLTDPPVLEILLHQAEDDPNDTPVPPIPPEAAEIADALARRGPEDASRRVGLALAEARANGRLAGFGDLYLLWLSNRLRLGGALPGDAPPTAAIEAGGTVLEEALAWTSPAGGAEELVALDRRIERAERRGDYAEGAARALEAAALSARAGLCDLPPTRSTDRGLTPGPTWAARRARADLLAAAAFAAAGKLEEARAAFLAGLARAPRDPETLRTSAQLKARTGFDLAGAEADALRAADLERRQGEPPSDASRAALARVRARARQAAAPAGAR